MEQRPTAAFVLSLLAGLWMLSTGGMMYGMGPGFMDGGGSMMWGHGMMRTFGPGLWFPWFGPVGGIILLIGAVFLYSKPEQSRTWGLVVLIVAALNVFVGMGGLLAGTLGVVGGALALSWNPPTAR